MAFNRGYQQQHSGPSPWAAGAPPYGPQHNIPHHGAGGFHAGGGGGGGFGYGGPFSRESGWSSSGPGGHFGGGPGPMVGAFNHPPVYGTPSRLGPIAGAGGRPI